MRKGLVFVLVFLMFLVTINNVLSEETIFYNHPSSVGANEMDCFDSSNSVCLTRETTGPVFNAGNTSVAGIQWGCGNCKDVVDWYISLDIDFKAGCANGTMPNIVGKELCLNTSTNGKWNIKFGWFQSGGGGGFNYTRTFFLENQNNDNNLINETNQTNNQNNVTNNTNPGELTNTVNTTTPTTTKTRKKIVHNVEERYDVNIYKYEKPIVNTNKVPKQEQNQITGEVVSELYLFNNNKTKSFNDNYSIFIIAGFGFLLVLLVFILLVLLLSRR